MGMKRAVVSGPRVRGCDWTAVIVTAVLLLGGVMAGVVLGAHGSAAICAGLLLAVDFCLCIGVIMYLPPET